MTIVSMNYLLEAGVHFGHQKRRWNPKMKPYIYTTRDDIYIIDLQKTSAKITEAYQAMKEIAEKEGKFLFVGTKKQAQEAVEEAATRTEQYFVNERWLGGTLTNFKTIRSRVRRMEEIEKMEEDGTFNLLPKKEVIGIKKEYEKLNRNLRGIRDMKRIPQALVIVDPRKEDIAIKEAHILNIPVFGIVDTNCDPDVVDYVIPANDDAVRSVKLIIGALANAIAEVNGKEIIDYVGDDDKAKDGKRAQKKENKFNNKKEFVKKEEKVKPTVEEKVEEPVVEEKKETPKAEEDLNSKTLVELKDLAKQAGIKGYSTMKKAELIDALQ